MKQRQTDQDWKTETSSITEKYAKQVWKKSKTDEGSITLIKCHWETRAE